MQIKDNKDKIKLNNQLPYLVGNVVEVLEMQPEEDEEDDGANVDLDAQRRGKCVVLKTSTRQTIFLPVVGLVDADALKPADLVGVNKVDISTFSTNLLLLLCTCCNDPSGHSQCRFCFTSAVSAHSTFCSPALQEESGCRILLS